MTITRHYSAKQPLTLKLIQERVLLVLNLYDKIDPTKVSFFFVYSFSFLFTQIGTHSAYNNAKNVRVFRATKFDPKFMPAGFYSNKLSFLPFPKRDFFVPATYFLFHSWNIFTIIYCYFHGRFKGILREKNALFAIVENRMKYLLHINYRIWKIR